VAVDKFIKWIEVRPVAKVTSEEAAKFMQDVTHYFSVPNRIITDLGMAFTGSAFRDFCQDNTIDVYYSSFAHPGATARSSVSMAWFFKLSKIVSLTMPQTTTQWLAGLPHVIWELRTPVITATGFSPFFLVYVSEAILPTDVTFGAPCIQFYEEREAEQTRRVDLDNLEEQRMDVVMRQLRRQH
jgi:hypothetical protein